MAQLTITPLTDTIGAEVSGIDLRATLDDATRRAIYRAWVDNIVLVFHEQTLSPADFVRFAGIFGTPLRQNIDRFAVPEQPDIGVLSSEDKDVAGSGRRYIRGVNWHTDHSYAERPPKATMLYGIDIPSKGGDTQFCSTRAAYEALDEATKRRIDGLKALHAYESSRSPRPMLARTPEEAALYPGNVVHPLVRNNPDTNRKAIYYNRNRTECILDMDRAESDALLDWLYAHMTEQPRFQYRHKWRPGDIVIWDNRSAMHQANADYNPGERRFLHRIMIQGERPL